MIKNLFSVFLLFFCLKTPAQKIVFCMGKNYTSYKFQPINDSNKNITFKQDTGDFFEIGINFNISKSSFFYQNPKFSYTLSMVYNQYNAKATDALISYNWESNYIGLNNKLNYKFFEDDYFNFLLNSGFGTMLFLNGEQYINSNSYNINDNEEFSGYILTPFVGLNCEYKINDEFRFGLGYNISKSFNVSNNSNEKVSFNTNSIQFGINMNLN